MCKLGDLAELESLWRKSKNDSIRTGFRHFGVFGLQAAGPSFVFRQRYKVATVLGAYHPGRFLDGWFGSLAALQRPVQLYVVD